MGTIVNLADYKFGLLLREHIRRAAQEPFAKPCEQCGGIGVMRHHRKPSGDVLERIELHEVQETDVNCPYCDGKGGEVRHG